MSLPLALVGPTTSATRVLRKGSGAIAGTTSVGGAAASCRVTLFSSDHMLIGFRRTGTDGTYSFPGLRPGSYYLLIADDNQGTHRAKVEHVEVT